jgi:DNA-binding PadR family transcriptional regulator
MKIIDAPQYGPMFRFTDASVYWALHILSDGKRMGRKRLSEEIGVGEGSMRRILNTLKENNFVDIKQTGITITKCGLAYLSELPIRVLDVDASRIVLGECSQAILVKGVSKMIDNGLQQRDAGIRVGALGCTTLVMRDNELILPPEWSIDKNEPEVAKNIKECSNMIDDDIIIIGSADNPIVAINAALTAAFELF